MVANKRIGLREIRALKPGGIIWDGAVIGFGARRQRSKAVAYVVVYRTAEGRQRWQTIGRHGSPWTPDTAREEAKRILGDVAGGSDPAGEKIAKRNATTVSELCDLYMADAEAGRLLTRRKSPKKRVTIEGDKGRIQWHIKPQLGSMSVAAVTMKDIDALMHAVAEGKTAARAKSAKKGGLARVSGGKATASRTVGLLGSIFTYAARSGIRADNPVRGVVRYADNKRERRLSDTEYKMLGTALEKAEEAKIWPSAIAATKFLALTGWRRSEATALRWEELDFGRRTATLGDTKTGRSVRPLSNAACDVLRTAPKLGELVFPATIGDGRLSFPKLWARIAKLGKLPPDLTPHTLRHSYASLASDLGYSEPTIAALVGHKGRSMTSRYVHAADAVLLVAADAVADRTTALMAGIVTQFRQATG